MRYREAFLSLFLLGLSQTARAQITQACYTGPPGTAGVGMCRTGTQSLVNGVWTPCEGEVTPWTDIPGNGMDEDCNGADLSIMMREASVEEEASFFSSHQPEIAGVTILSMSTSIALIVLIRRRRRSIRQRDIVTERIPR